MRICFLGSANFARENKLKCSTSGPWFCDEITYCGLQDSIRSYLCDAFMVTQRIPRLQLKRSYASYDSYSTRPIINHLNYSQFSSCTRFASKTANSKRERTAISPTLRLPINERRSAVGDRCKDVGRGNFYDNTILRT